MEKRISYAQFQSVKAVAKACDPIQRKIEPLRKKIEALEEQCSAYEKQIKAIEKGIVEVTGFSVYDLVKKVVETTGTDANGKPIKSTKWQPTDIVSYDDKNKMYIVRSKEETEPTLPFNEVKEEEAPIVPPTTEGGFGSDFDLDKERVQQEAVHTFDPVESDSIFD